MEAAISLITGALGMADRKKAERQARIDAERAQQRQLATLAAENAKLDQQKAVATPGNARGRRLLNYVLTSDAQGQQSLGG